MYVNVFIGLGSNVGQRKRNIRKGLELLGARQDVEIQRVSTLIETKPEGVVKQPDFLNGVAQLQTILTPSELLKVTADIEKKLGRTSKGHYDPRTLDLDILFYDKLVVVDEEGLTVPHPLIQDRSFVLEPMVEIAPEFVHPILGETMSVLLHKRRGY